MILSRTPEVWSRRAQPQPGPLFETFWRFAAERHRIFTMRLRGLQPPWTDDEILGSYRFTNTFRASDRVSQYLIRNVTYRGDPSAREVFFRTILFKLFNRIETWRGLMERLGEPHSGEWTTARLSKALDASFRCGQRLYSAAYIMPCASENPRGERKHEGHVRLMAKMLEDRAYDRFFSAASLETATAVLRAYRGLGAFLSFQFAIDLNYSSAGRFDEMDHVVPGPGARDGLKKCFSSFGELPEADVIRWTAERQTQECEARGIDPITLWGRPLQLVDIQNVFCEVDKYSRVRHPDVQGHSGRTRIKRRFEPRAEPLAAWYPPKWNVRVTFEKRDAR